MGRNNSVDLLRIRPAGESNDNQQFVFAGCGSNRIVLRILASFADFDSSCSLFGLFLYAACSPL